jgi:hypothetical protein
VHSRAEFLRILGRRGGTIAGAFILGYLIDSTWARLVRGLHLERERYPRLVLGNVRVHHNVAGYVAILAGLVVYPTVLIPLGLGIIVGHGLRDRLFWFIERLD